MNMNQPRRIKTITVVIENREHGSIVARRTFPVDIVAGYQHHNETYKMTVFMADEYFETMGDLTPQFHFS